MKAIHTALISLLAVAAPAAYVIFHPATRLADPGAVVGEQMKDIAPLAAPLTTETVQAADPEPVQPLEERGDAMLFEMEALQNMPFDQSITMPFD